MKKLLLTLSLLLTLGLSASGVAAQVDGVDAPEIDVLDFSEIEGLETVYDRTYSVDFMALLSTPDVDFENMDYSEMLRSVSITAYTFDSEDSARSYVDESKGELESSMDEASEELDELEVKDLEVVDNDGITFTMVMTSDDMSIAVTAHVILDGETVFMVTAVDGDLEASNAAADGVAKYVADSEVESEDVNFSEDGTSTGGVYDRMPQAGDDLVSDLTVTDMQIYPEAGS